MTRIRRRLAAVAALAALLPLGTHAIDAAARDKVAASISIATEYDRVIDAVVAQRVATKQLTPADALVAREQMQLQFRSLSVAQQRGLLATTRNLGSAEAALAAGAALHAAVVEEARKALAEVQAAARPEPNIPGAYVGPQPKLGGDGDYVFVPTAGPCRVADSRFSATGQLGATAARQLWAYSNGAGYDFGTNQGGTGIAGSGNCVGTVFDTAVPSTTPVSVVATIAVVNTVLQGSMRAWNGGTTLTVGGVLGWNAGDLLSNTTVIPLNRFIAAYPGSGSKRDFALYNNSGAAIDYVVDVVGYFIMNQATALECTTVFGSAVLLAPGSSQFIDAPACPAGYTSTQSMPEAAAYGLYIGTLATGGCRISNGTAVGHNVYCDARCCRVPGR